MTNYATSTFSIVAFDAASNRIGAATASCVLGLGGRVLFHRSEGPIVLMQHIEYAPLADRIVADMQAGLPPQQAVEQAMRTDPQAQQRQMLAVDLAGRFGLWSGSECSPVYAHAHRGAVAAAGNCLSRESIPQQMLDAYDAATGEPLSIRLLRAIGCAAALKADQRGLQSAALLSIPRTLDSWKSQIVNLRADLHEDPVGELGRLYDVFKSRFGPQ